MALNIADNFKYQGKKPNFERDSFATKAAMKAFPETSIDEGHIAYCAEDKQHYVYSASNPVDGVTGKWKPQLANIKSDVAELKSNITEYNVSKRHPNEGIGGTNKYTLATAIAKIPAELRTVGIKCSFIGEDGISNVYTYQGRVYAEIQNWLRVDGKFIQDIRDNNPIVYGDIRVGFAIESISCNFDVKSMEVCMFFNRKASLQYNSQYIGINVLSGGKKYLFVHENATGDVSFDRETVSMKCADLPDKEIVLSVNWGAKVFADFIMNDNPVKINMSLVQYKENVLSLEIDKVNLEISKIKKSLDNRFLLNHVGDYKI